MNAPGLVVERSTWVPARTLSVGGWMLGLTGGLTRRANSATPAVPGTSLSDAELLEIESRYAEAGQPSIFRICAAAPSGLVDRLAARGYACAVVTEVWARALGPVETAPGVLIDDAEVPDPAWLDGWLGVKGPGADLDLAGTLLTGSPARYLTARAHDGSVLGVLRLALAGEWAGLSCLAVTPAARRRGIGRALTLAGLNAACRHGADNAFLQVEVQNSGALALYTALGFAPVDRYEYWER